MSMSSWKKYENTVVMASASWYAARRQRLITSCCTWLSRFFPVFQSIAMTCFPSGLATMASTMHRRYESLWKKSHFVFHLVTASLVSAPTRQRFILSSTGRSFSKRGDNSRCPSRYSSMFSCTAEPKRAWSFCSNLTSFAMYLA